MREKAKLVETLAQDLCWVVNPVACLGLGATSVATKVRLVLHSLWMQMQPPRFPSLIEVLPRVVSVTTDMGTELGIADFVVPTIRSVLPRWMYPDQHQLVVMPTGDGMEEGCVDMEDPDSCDPAVEGEVKHVFPRGLLVAGVLHVIHNLSWRLGRAMSYFDEWLCGMKAIVTLLHYRDNRKLFAERCVSGSRFDRAGRHAGLNRGCPSAQEWRWSSIVLTLKSILPLEPLLTSCFDTHKMRPRDRDVGDNLDNDEAPARVKEGKLDLGLIQRTVRNGKWWAFAEMLCTIHKVLAQFQEWSESCPCHYHHLLLDKDEKEELRDLEAEAGIAGAAGASRECPLAGLRAPEMAAGSWKIILEVLFDKALDVFIGELCPRALDHLDSILSDFEEGKKQVYASLEVKFQIWESLPWKLMAVASGETKKAAASSLPLQGLGQRGEVCVEVR